MLRRPVIAPVLLLVLVGCGRPPAPSVTEDPGGDSSSLVEGVPGDCALLGTADPDLAEELLASIAADVAHGPLVVARFGGQAVVATTTYERPGVQGRAAAWTVVDGMVTAINEEADRISTVAVGRVDSAGEDALARAMAEAEDCSWVVADRSAEDPPEPDPSMRPDLLVVEPPVAGPGTEVALRFPQETSRGIAFQLDRRTADGWETTHWMSSDANGEQYQDTVAAGTEGYGVIDVGVGGPGPDGVVLPDDVEPGEYRICTANAGDEFCALLEVTSDAG